MLSRAFVLAQLGHPRPALADVTEAARIGPRAVRPFLHLQHAGVLGVLGRDQEAVVPATKAVRSARRRRDWLGLGRALQTRALRFETLGDVRRAARDNLAAIEAYDRIGQRAGVAMCRANLATVVALGGDLPAALRAIDRAYAELEAVGIDPALGADGRFEALHMGRLDLDARRVAADAAVRLHAGGATVLAAQAQVNEARSALRLGLLDDAMRCARSALADLPIDSPWADIAHLVLGRAGADDIDTRRLTEIALRLAATGWTTHATGALLVAATALARQGDHQEATALLDRVAARRTHGTVEVRIQSWTALALRRSLTGTPEAAVEAAGQGLRLLAEHRRSVGAAELRIAATGLGVELVAAGTDAAVATERAEVVAEWLGVVATTRVAPVGSPSAGEADLVGALRTVRAQIERSILARTPVPPALVRRQAELETALRDLDRRAGNATTRRTETPRSTARPSCSSRPAANSMQRTSRQSRPHD